jgi:hypothetical protein
MNPQWVCYKLEETIEMPSTDLLASHQRKCGCALAARQKGEVHHLDTGVSHYSWGMCTTSAECKTVMTAVLTVKSGMDPHMISRDFGWFGNGFDCVAVTKVRSSWS